MTSVLARSQSAATESDHRDPLLRLSQLLDVDSVTSLHHPDDSGVLAVRGTIDGSPVFAYCTDATKMGGALGLTGTRHIVTAIDAAVREGAPVIGLWHCGGARLADGVESLHGCGRMFSAMTRASGKVPQISVVLGPAAGAAAYGPALTDVIVMAEQGRVFVTGPDVVKTVTGEEIDMEGLGGGNSHSRKSGVVHVTVGTESEAYSRTRRLVGFFGKPGLYDLSRIRGERNLRELLPDSPRRAYDVHPLVHAIVDAEKGGPVFEELQPKWAPNILIGLGRLGGHTIGVIANNPLRKGGCLDSLSAEKAARFVRLCDAFGIPLLVLVDVPGYLPGVGQEWGGVVRRGAKLLHAFAETVVPRVTLITRKSYGGAYIAMNSRSLGATAVFAWPEAEVAVMGAEAAVNILHRRKLAAAPEEEREALRLELVAEQQRVAGGVDRAMDIGVVDEVIEPRHTRRRLAEALAAAPAARGQHGNIPL
ncbi:acetyl-CoA/propionyl-CoA carboxylase carboxyl transferase subunit [Herbihabitans rhizosphaerae]|uniref:Acetyl-CoA/propionyl-CoA carboxylase carboxyl transferase subunit n=1 Tax=Herbihabitans rhizosphaerae TaxID=1872711 RepID=A0A4Q7KK03_9PSEU|nr:carboxyl transferase domain-containing protein [Herbihabitans rhizosphaerae]RZS36534.1 acetyl-CoA/propionyl-CoA carboxylase carboxyl transferase subunit [Herbihabitans rhizosphaerae]